MLNHLPNAEWRLLFGLARWGGLRTPSEPRLLEWSHIDWERNRFLVHAPKTERHHGRATRWVPIFPELVPLFRERFEEATPGDIRVLPRLSRRSGHKSTLAYATRLAGVETWTRLWHSLRSMRETELCDHFPEHVVSAWIGNTVAVARRHYLKLTESHFEQAVAFTAEAAQKAAQSASATQRTDSPTEMSETADALDSHSLTHAGEGVR